MKTPFRSTLQPSSPNGTVFSARQFRPFLRWGEPWTAYFLEYLVVAYITNYSCCQVSCVNSFTSSEGLKKNLTEMAS